MLPWQAFEFDDDADIDGDDDKEDDDGDDIDDEFREVENIYDL